MIPLTLAQKNSTAFPQTEAIPTPLEIHPSISPLAAELLMKTAEKLAHEPKSYCQSAWCGAMCCIIGWMESLAGEVHGCAPSAIGLTNAQRVSIYYYCEWPAHLRTSGGHLGSFATPADGIARINHFLATGE